MSHSARFSLIAISFALFLASHSYGQRSIWFYEPDFDTAYCIHSLLYANTGVDGYEMLHHPNRAIDVFPHHYYDFYSPYHHKFPKFRDNSMASYDSLGFVIRGVRHSLVFRNKYSADKKSVTTKYFMEMQRVMSPIDQFLNWKEEYTLNENNSLQRMALFNKAEKLKSVVSFDYDLLGRIVRISEVENDSLHILHKYTYTELSKSGFIAEQGKLQKQWVTQMRFFKLPFDEKLKFLYDAGDLRKLVADATTLYRQYDSATNDVKYIATGNEFVYCFSVYKIYSCDVRTHFGACLYKWENGKLVQSWRCSADFGKEVSNFVQEVNILENGRWHQFSDAPEYEENWERKTQEKGEKPPFKPNPKHKLHEKVLAPYVYGQY